jgi:hypothetical protein
VALRTGHGNGAGVPRIEVRPIDELPDGVPGESRAESPADRGPLGKFAPGNGLAKLGGKARKGKTRLADRLGLRSLNDDASFKPYRASSEAFRRAQCNELASNVGGGVCGPAPSSLVASAALQLGWSRYLSDVAGETGDAAMALQASKLADASRQNLLAAHELCALEAKARTAHGAGAAMPWLLPPKDEKR